MHKTYIPLLAMLLWTAPSHASVSAYSGAYYVEQYQDTPDPYGFWQHSLGEGTRINIEGFQSTINTSQKHTFSNCWRPRFSGVMCPDSVGVVVHLPSVGKRSVSVLRPSPSSS